MAAAAQAQQHRRADRGTEQDQLLAQRVEAAQVERRAGDRVRDVALGERELDRLGGVRVGRMAEVAQPGHGPEGRDAEDSERDQSGDAARRGPHGIRASASSAITGTATVPTTIADSATSGAPKTKNSNASARPKKPDATSW